MISREKRQRNSPDPSPMEKKKPATPRATAARRCGLTVFACQAALTLDAHKRRAVHAKIIKVIKELISSHDIASFCVDVCHYTPNGRVCQ